MISALWTICLLVLLSRQGYATVVEIENLFARMDHENSEIRVARHSLDYHEQSLRVSQSFLYPSLNLNASLNKSRDVNAPSTSTTTSGDTPAPSPSGTDTPSPSRPGTVTNTGDGWNTQLSTNYSLFAHFGIDQSIKSSKLRIQSATYELSKQRASKRSQFIQALLEWQWLRGLQTPLAQAGKIIKKVKDHADRKSSTLYSDLDRVELLQKEMEIYYNTIKVHEGVKLVAFALKDLLPSVTMEELDRLPKIAVYYPLAPADTLESAYISRSLSRKTHENDVRIAGGNYEVATWKKPWIPSITLTGSYSKFGDYKGSKPDDTWSAGLLFSFNIFDGFYTQARRAQTHIGLETAEEKLRLATSKTLVGLRAQTMKALVSQAEYKLKDSTVKRRRIELQQTESKQTQGVGSELEVSAATLHLVKAKFDALDALKNYQSATLEIAVELNEWDRVNIHDITN